MNYTRNNLEDTICALATPMGTGAIGVIRISGPKAISIVSDCFKGKNLNEVPSHTLHLGKMMDGKEIIDEVLAAVFIAPKSYTGDHTIELSGHGSPYILQRILELLVKNGCRMAQPGEFTLRAFLNKKLDLSQAEAVADLIASTSSESHRTAMTQMRGGFSKQIQDLKERLVNFASLIELELDFSEEDVEFASRPELKTLVSNIVDLITVLLDSFKYGNAIKNGIPTVIAGKPNAGKSTLLNALIKDDRAIVSDIAGTTRDVIEESFVIKGVSFRLIDTAGIRKDSVDIIENIGIEKTFERIQKASIIMYMFDASTTDEKALKEELGQFDGINAVIVPVANKTDLPEAKNQTYDESLNVIPISCKTSTGLNLLEERLVEIIEKDKVKNDVIITNLRHYEALNNARESLLAVLGSMESGRSGELLAFDIRKGIFHLGEITGDISTDDLLANIFSKFCIGK
ncbi:MAG: tRNA uridine-5-carboxymethylaminomethyl(34) synthesis GTPase MnmE [Bacteroidia bacterium]